MLEKPAPAYFPKDFLWRESNLIKHELVSKSTIIWNALQTHLIEEKAALKEYAFHMWGAPVE